MAHRVHTAYGLPCRVDVAEVAPSVLGAVVQVVGLRRMGRGVEIDYHDLVAALDN